MSRLFAFALSCCLAQFFLIGQVAAKDCFTAPADDCPSDAAAAMPGALGKKGFSATELGLEKEVHATTFWYDTDGVQPGIAGCHIGVTDGSGDKKPDGRTFGEACIDDVTLIESNPGAGVVHGHKDDHGHPDLFNCPAWCKGQGKAAGSCEKVVTGLEGCTASARCTCG